MGWYEGEVGVLGWYEGEVGWYEGESEAPASAGWYEEGDVREYCGEWVMRGSVRLRSGPGDVLLRSGLDTVRLRSRPGDGRNMEAIGWKGTILGFGAGGGEGESLIL